MQPIYEYTIDYFDWQTGKLERGVLVGLNEGHAIEEAFYEFGGEVLRVTQGPWLYDE